MAEQEDTYEEFNDELDLAFDKYNKLSGNIKDELSFEQYMALYLSHW